MGRPRVRLTIGRLMVLVLLASLASWGVFVVLPRQRGPSIAEQLAEARYKRARFAREMAEMALVEFSPAVDRRNLDTIRGMATLAMSDFDRSIDRLEWSTRMQARGYVSEATRTADRLTMEHAGFEFEQARDQFDGLRKFAKAGTTGPPNPAVEKARADERAKLEAFRKERAKRGGLGF